MSTIINHKDDVKVMFPNKPTKFEFSYADFNLNHSTQKDKDFGNMLFSDEFDWDIIAKSKKHNAKVFVSPNTYFPKVDIFGNKIFKFSMVLNHSLKKCVYATGTKDFLKINTSVSGIKLRSYCVEDDRSISKSSCDMEVQMKSPFPVSTSRKFYQNYTQTFNDDTGECIGISKPHTRNSFLSELNQMDLSRKIRCLKAGKPIKLYLHMFYAFYKLKKMGINRTLYSFIAFISEEGLKSNKYFKLLTNLIIGKQIIKIFTKDINKTLKNVPEDFSLAKNKSKDPFLQLLIDNEFDERIDKFEKKQIKKKHESFS